MFSIREEFFDNFIYINWPEFNFFNANILITNSHGNDPESEYVQNLNYKWKPIRLFITFSSIRKNNIEKSFSSIKQRESRDRYR